MTLFSAKDVLFQMLTWLLLNRIFRLWPFVGIVETIPTNATTYES